MRLGLIVGVAVVTMLISVQNDAAVQAQTNTGYYNPAIATWRAATPTPRPTYAPGITGPYPMMRCY